MSEWMMPREIWAAEFSNAQRSWQLNQPIDTHKLTVRKWARYIRADDAELSAEDAQLLELVRLLDQFVSDDGLSPDLTLVAMGRQAVEVSFPYDIGFKVSTIADAVAELRSRIKPEKPTDERMAEAIDYAQQLIADGKYQEALDMLCEIGDAWDAWQEWEREYGE